MTYQCPHCSRPIAADAAFCPHCGGRLTMAASGQAPMIPGTPAPATKRSPLYYLMAIAGLAIALGGGYVSLFGLPPSGGGSTTTQPAAVDIPPVGQVWFGSSFDTTTLGIRGRKGTATAGETIALVAHLPRSISSGDGNIRITLDGTTITNQPIEMEGSGELFGVTYTLPVAGSYVVTITDLGGNVLASGSIVAT